MIAISSSEHMYMGNKLLQYAIFIAYSNEYNVALSNPSFAPYAHHYKTTSNDFWCRYPAKVSWFKGSKKLRMACYKFFYHGGRLLASKKLSNSLFGCIDIGWDQLCKIDAEEFIRRTKRTRLLLVMGWEFRHDFDLVKHRPLILKHLEPLDNYQQNVRTLINTLRNGADLLVGIHIRHGDYKTFEGGRYYYEAEQYRVLMEQFSKLSPGKKIRFVICSNSEQKKEDFNPLDIAFGTGHPVEDMYSLSECDYIMGPPSTYTIWASFYGNKPLYMIEKPEVDLKLENFKIKNAF